VRSFLKKRQAGGKPPASKQQVMRKVKVARKPAARRPAPHKIATSKALATPVATPAADTLEALPEDAGRSSQEQALRAKPLRAFPEQSAIAAPLQSENGRPAVAIPKPRLIQQTPAGTASIQKAGIADKVMGVFTSKMLAQAANFIGQIPDETFGPLTSVAKAGLHGFIKRLAAIPPTKLVTMAKRVFSAVQSPHYVLGFLLGLLKGFVIDGLLGIFVLFYDLAKLAIKLPTWGYKVAKRIGAPAIMALVGDISSIGQWISTNAPALAAGLLEQLGGKGGLSGAVAQITGYLLTKAKGGASKIGNKIASGLVSFFSQSKAKIGRALGEVAGRLSGAVLFEIILAVLTSGGGSAITAVKTSLKAVLGLLGKIGRGFLKVIVPLGKVLGRALRALKGWILALAHTGPLKGLSTKLTELFEKLSKFIKTVVGRLTGAGKAGAASTGGRPRVPPEGLPAPDSLPRGAKTTTEGLPAPASIPRAGAIRSMWTRAQEARAFAKEWIITRGRGLDVVEFYDHRHFVEYFRNLAGKAREIPVAFVNGEGKLVLDLTRVKIPVKWYHQAPVRVPPQHLPSRPQPVGTTQPPVGTTQPPVGTTQPPG